MDPLTQGAVGAAIPLSTRRGKPVTVAAGCGFLAGLAPDLDIVLHDPKDTLLASLPKPCLCGPTWAKFKTLLNLFNKKRL